MSAAIDAIRAAEPVRRGVKPKGISSAEIGRVAAADCYQYSRDNDNGKGGEFTLAALHGWKNGYCDDAPCGEPAGAAVVRESTRSWIPFAVGADALLDRGLTSDDVSIASFGPSSTAGYYEFQVGIAGVSIGAGDVENSRRADEFGLDVEPL